MTRAALVIEWQRLVDIRERREAIAQQRVLAARRESDAAAALVEAAARRLREQVTAKAAHWSSTVDGARHGQCSIEQLRGASAWSGALDRQIERAAAGRDAAAGDAAHADAALQRSRRDHGVAVRGVEKAQRLHEREAARARRVADARQEDVADAFAAQAWPTRGER